MFKLLGEGRVYAGDADLNKLELYFPILNIIRNENKKYEYKPDSQLRVVVIDEDGYRYRTVAMDVFLKEAALLLKGIKESQGSSFELPATEFFMKSVGCSAIKASSEDKSDIHIVTHDPRTHMESLLGFSIKSQLGSAATLLNASKATNITYRITGSTLTDKDVSEINAIKEQAPRMEALFRRGCDIEFFKIDSTTFCNNLKFIDFCMPQFIAHCLKESYKMEVGTSIKDCVHSVAASNPLNFSGNCEMFYASKMKKLLIDAALGMTPAKEWDGHYDAIGGYLVVLEDGDILCYHFYNRNEIEDYMFNNTRLERGDRNRHKYGEIYTGEDGDRLIKLNLQIRFKK